MHLSVTFRENKANVTADIEYPCEVTETTTAGTTARTNHNTVVAGSGTSSSYCCACKKVTKTPDEIQEEIEEIKKELTLDAKSLSSYQRTKTSASDSRPSSSAIGAVAIIILTLVVSLIIFADSPYILKHLKKLYYFLGKKSTGKRKS